MSNRHPTNQYPGHTDSFPMDPVKQTRPGGDPVEAIFAGLGLVIVYAIFLSRFNLALLVSDTILTGGDSASWLQPLEHLVKEYLPRFRFFGYSHSNFFGYLEGQHYFVLPFLVPALLGSFMPLTVALKLATFAGCLALPATMYAGTTSLTGSRRAGLLASAGSLAFLFNESYTMFGGNFLSTFAGEFCYSWAIALLPLFVAAVWKDFTRGKAGARSGILLGLMGLCHLFVFMPAFFLPFFFLLEALWKVVGARRRLARADEGKQGPEWLPARLITVIVGALLVMAFWFLPMATTRAQAQSISMVWNFASFTDFAKQTLLPVWATAVLVLLAMTVFLKDVARRKALFILYALGACGAMFVISRFLEIPDIRFVPPALIFSILAFSLGVHELGRRVTGLSEGILSYVTPLVLVVIIGGAAAAISRNASGWFEWNYSGYQAKQGWKDLDAISQFCKDDIRTGRILWEKQNQRDNADFGSERGFENLFMFTGLPSAEGIHYGSSFMARAVTYMQSEYSPEPVDPEAWRIYSRINPDVWPLRFAQTNSRYMITHSPTITALFAGRQDFEPVFTSGKFTVFRYKDSPSSYIEVRKPEDIVVLTESAGGYRGDFYRYFREYALIHHPFVPKSFAPRAGTGDSPLKDVRRLASFKELQALVAKESAEGYPGWRSYAGMVKSGAGRLSGSGRLTGKGQGEGEVRAQGEGSSRESGVANSLDDRSLDDRSLANDSRIVEEHIDAFTIAFKTDSPGKPHILKFSWAPGWKSAGGEKIYPVSPGFMLLYPGSEHVELVYTRSRVEIAGLVLTLLSPLWFLLAHFFLPRAPRLWKPFVLVASALYFLVIGSLIAVSTIGVSRMLQDIQEARALDLSRPAMRDRALELVTPWAREPLLEKQDSLLVFEAFRIKAQVLVQENKYQEAAKIVDFLKERYPLARALEWLPAVRNQDSGN